LVLEITEQQSGGRTCECSGPISPVLQKTVIVAKEETTMNGKAESIAMTILIGAVYCHPSFGQAPPVTILEVDVENAVEYQGDVSDAKQFATNPNITPVNGKGAGSLIVVH
jgi:hypothetical protein